MNWARWPQFLGYPDNLEQCPGFFLWGFIQDIIYKKVLNIDDLKSRITITIATVDANKPVPNEIDYNLYNLHAMKSAHVKVSYFHNSKSFSHFFFSLQQDSS